uniref:SCP domain-containing protein n=1 Tax=Noctiluca scintillans TaxID=2966 RepID=A0A7S1B1C1_NOCSC
MHAVLRHILSDPESDKFRKIRVHNQQFRNRIGRFPPAVALLRSIGFVKGDYWVSAFQKEPCLEFLLPVDSDNPFSQRFVRAFSLIDELLQAPDEWLRTVAPAPPAVQSQWAERDSGDLDDLGGSQVPLRGDVGSREYLADLHERRVKDPRGFQEAMLAAGKRPNHTVVDVRMPAQQDSSISPADATALSTAASGSGSNVRYRSIADRFGGRRHFNLQDIEQVRVEEAIAGTPQYAREYQATKGPSRSYADVVDRSYDPQFLGRRALDETNIFRGQQNMPPLKWSQALSNIAEEHAQQMARGEMPFSHKGFNDRVQKYPFPYMSAAENLAYNGGVADTAKVAVDGWIKSPGHRRNLLGAFDLCGIGVARSSTGEFFFTQLFARTVGGSLC